MTKREIIIATSLESGIYQTDIKQCLEPVFKCILEALSKGEKRLYESDKKKSILRKHKNIE